MKNPMKKYPQSNLVMINHAETVHSSFLEDKSDFVAGFPGFADPFADNFLAAINDISVTDKDDYFTGQIAVSVESIGGVMEDSRRLVAKFYSYIRLGFAGSRAVLKSFGNDELKRSLTNYQRMSALLLKIQRQSELPENKPVLLGVGIQQADIDMLGTLSGSLDAEFETLSDFKSARVRNTVSRIEKYNAVWSFMQQLAAASKELFRDNPARRVAYNLNFGRRKPAKDDIQPDEERSDSPAGDDK